MFKSLQVLLVGVCIGILVAPDKGSSTRKKIIDSLSESKDELEGAMSDNTDNAE